MILFISFPQSRYTFERGGGQNAHFELIWGYFKIQTRHFRSYFRGPFFSWKHKKMLDKHICILLYRRKLFLIFYKYSRFTRKIYQTEYFNCFVNLFEECEGGKKEKDTCDSQQTDIDVALHLKKQMENIIRCISTSIVMFKCFLKYYKISVYFFFLIKLNRIISKNICDATIKKRSLWESNPIMN